MFEIVNNAVCAISSGVVILFSNGILFTIDFSFSSPFSKVLIQVAYAGVKLSAIIIALTRIPYLIKSTAHSLVNPRIPPFDAA